MNQVILRGRLTDNPAIRYTKEQASVASFCLAVADRMAPKDKDGNFPADFIRVVAFGKEAEVLEAFAVKGTELLITGKLKSGSYDKDGVKVFTTECQVVFFEFINGTKQKAEKRARVKSKTAKKVGAVSCCPCFFFYAADLRGGYEDADHNLQDRNKQRNAECAHKGQDHRL